MAKTRKAKKKKDKKNRHTRRPPRDPRYDGNRQLERACRLLDAEKWEEAILVLEELRGARPHHDLVLSGLAVAYEKTGQTAKLAATTRQIATLHPDDPELCLAAAEAELFALRPALAVRTYRRFLDRWPRREEAERVREKVEQIVQVILTSAAPIPGVTDERELLEILAMNDEVVSLMELGDWDRTLRAVEKLRQRAPQFAPAANHLVQLRILQGRFQEAAAGSQEILDRDPDNLHALANLVRCYAVQAQFEEARRWADRLRSIQSNRDDRWVKQAEAFSFLGEDQQVLAVFADRHASGPRAAIPGDDVLHHFAGAAALRLGRESEARGHWRKALKLNPRMERAEQNLEDLRRPVKERHAPWAFEQGDWLAVQPLEQLGKALRSSGAKTDSVLNEFLRKHPHGVRLIPTLLERGHPFDRQFAATLAKFIGSPETHEALKTYALSNWGPDQGRLDAASYLIREGVMQSGTVSMWIDGKPSEILLLGFAVTDEPLNRPQSPKVARLGDRAFQAFREADGVKAERLFREVIELAPDAPEWKQNLAGALQMQGREAEATALLDENIRQHPDYFFSKTELAFRAIRRRDYAKATEILTGLLQTSLLHRTQFRALVAAFMELYRRQNQIPSARMWYDMWTRFDPDDEEINRLARKLNENPLYRMMPWNW